MQIGFVAHQLPIFLPFCMRLHSEPRSTVQIPYSLPHNALDRMQSEASKQIGMAARKRRKTLGLSQENLGDIAGCGRLFVSQFENGKAEVRLDKVLDLLQALGLEFHLKSGSHRLVIETND